MEPLRYLVIGAHPDDADVSAGGTAVLWARAGHVVKFVSLTNGDAGHHEIGGVELARRRHREAQEAAAAGGIREYQILDNHDGELEATLVRRREVIRLLREYRPDLVVTHRPWDYHPDHRATATLVMDASYTVTVPNVAPLTGALAEAPRICYHHDGFTSPLPFRAHVVVPIDTVIEAKLSMMECHGSQMYEWLPFNRGVLGEVPRGAPERRRWLAGQWLPGFAKIANENRAALVARLGETAGRAVRYAEAFEISEYGANPDPEVVERLFPVMR